VRSHEVIKSKIQNVDNAQFTMQNQWSVVSGTARLCEALVGDVGSIFPDAVYGESSLL
jgi:hypothetical protein